MGFKCITTFCKICSLYAVLSLVIENETNDFVKFRKEVVEKGILSTTLKGRHGEY